MNPSRKRKASEIDIFYFDISPKRRRLDTRKMKTTIRRKTGKKVSKGAKIRNRYNQVPHLTQDTNGKVTNLLLDTTNESQEVSSFPAGDLKEYINRRTQRHSKHKTEKT